MGWRHPQRSLPGSLVLHGIGPDRHLRDHGLSRDYLPHSELRLDLTEICTNDEGW